MRGSQRTCKPCLALYEGIQDDLDGLGRGSKDCGAPTYSGPVPGLTISDHGFQPFPLI